MTRRSCAARAVSIGGRFGEDRPHQQRTAGRNAQHSGSTLPAQHSCHERAVHTGDAVHVGATADHFTGNFLQVVGLQLRVFGRHRAVNQGDRNFRDANGAINRRRQPDEIQKP